jgi:hypothetical protein
MGRAFTRALGVSAAVVFAGAIAPASASEASITVVTKASLAPLYGGASTLPPAGFDLVTTSEKPPKFADYTILNLIMLATPWPIEEAAAQAEVPVPIVAAPLKRKPKSKRIVEKRPEKVTWLQADWWRQLTWLRIR